MAFEEQLPQWENEGTQPPQSKRVEGWLPNEKPPASWFNWLFGRTYKVLQELQQKAETKTGAQAKADAAEQAANLYTDQRIGEVEDDLNDIKNWILQGEATITANQTNGYFRDFEPFVEISLPQINTSNYGVLMTPTLYDDLGRIGELIAYDKTQNGFKVKMTGSASTVTFIWTLINPRV